MGQINERKRKKQSMSAVRQRGGLHPVKDKTKRKHAPLTHENLRLPKGHDEELMGRTGMALLAYMRMARLKEADGRAAQL